MALTLVQLIAAVILLCGEARAEYVCVEGDCVGGEGKLVLKDSAGSMEGRFWNGELIKGKAVFPNGDVFEGWFKNNMLVNGTKRFQDGTVQEGKFLHNMLVDGKVTYPNGSTRAMKMKVFGDMP
ncbi:MAG: hypothetical protein HY579_08185 [Nitrospinae bacterium]|nr:hypothetical protein [Nitrospinota bacterium]